MGRPASMIAMAPGCVASIGHCVAILRCVMFVYVLELLLTCTLDKPQLVQLVTGHSCNRWQRLVTRGCSGTQALLCRTLHCFAGATSSSTPCLWQINLSSLVS